MPNTTTTHFLFKTSVWLMLAALMLVNLALAQSRPTLGQRVNQPQSPQQYAALLKRIKLPLGFSINVFAVVPGARHMAVNRDGSKIFVGTYNRDLWLIQNHGASPTVHRFMPNMTFKYPGVCFTPKDDLIVVDHNRVVKFIASPDKPMHYRLKILVADGELIPRRFESRGHGARVCRVGQHNDLYIALGQPHNVPPANRVATYEKLGIGGIIKLNARTGKDRLVFARGIRNSVGMDINPRDHSLWWTDNQVDWLGPDVPPGELNRSSQAGQHFGFPYWNGRFKVAGSAVARDLAQLPPPPNAEVPKFEFQAHQAQLGLTFYQGDLLPKAYHGGLFVAARGSWNRQPPSGALIDFVKIDAHNQVRHHEVFAQGWLDQASARYLGRPVDVGQLPDGSLLVSDDQNGLIYRISYRAP